MQFLRDFPFTIEHFKGLIGVGDVQAQYQQFRNSFAVDDRGSLRYVGYGKLKTLIPSRSANLTNNRCRPILQADGLRGWPGSSEGGR